VIIAMLYKLIRTKIEVINKEEKSDMSKEVPSRINNLNNPKNNNLKNPLAKIVPSIHGIFHGRNSMEFHGIS
jgi:hypothetical protein